MIHVNVELLPGAPNEVNAGFLKIGVVRYQIVGQPLERRECVSRLSEELTHESGVVEYVSLLEVERAVRVKRCSLVRLSDPPEVVCGIAAMVPSRFTRPWQVCVVLFRTSKTHPSCDDAALSVSLDQCFEAEMASQVKPVPRST